MVKSMTGYGRGKQLLNGRNITVEVRSVNNRYLDCTLKLPRAYTFAEDALRTEVQGAVARGKVDVFVTVETAGADEVDVQVNLPLAKGYFDALRSIEKELSLAEDCTAATIAHFPDVISVTKAEEDTESVTEDLKTVLKEALQRYTEMREREGEKLAEDIFGRLTHIEDLTAEVEKRSPETVREYREKLYQKMKELLEGKTVDEGRILQEAAIYADKVAVDEETVRLHSHVAQLRDMLQYSEPIGRKMDFLIQEVNRESNTIGSKCSDLAISHVVVELKAEVEKIREQVQNIE